MKKFLKISLSLKTIQSYYISYYKKIMSNILDQPIKYLYTKTTLDNYLKSKYWVYEWIDDGVEFVIDTQPL